MGNPNQLTNLPIILLKTDVDLTKRELEAIDAIHRTTREITEICLWSIRTINLTKLLLTPLLNQSQQNSISNRLFQKECIKRAYGDHQELGKHLSATVEAANALIELNQRILICPIGTFTVDNTLRCIIKQLRDFGWNEASIRRTISRTGNLSRIADDIKPYFSRNSNDLALAKIVGTYS